MEHQNGPRNKVNPYCLKYLYLRDRLNIVGDRMVRREKPGSGLAADLRPWSVLITFVTLEK